MAAASGSSVVYLDTGNGFSSRRVHQIIVERFGKVGGRGDERRLSW